MLTECRSDAPHADEYGMWGVLRHVQGSEEEPDAEAYEMDPDAEAYEA